MPQSDFLEACSCDRGDSENDNQARAAVVKVSDSQGRTSLLRSVKYLYPLEVQSTSE